jgi:methylated-DNA-[protein]-cysteine S-methyltransferase
MQIRITIDASMLYQAALDTPIGRLLIEGNRESITGIRFVSPTIPVGRSNPVITAARKQLREYFAGKRKSFDIPLSLAELTPFQRIVLSHVAKIEHGQTSTYAEIARRMRKLAGPRAVGQANARNPLCIVIPCHRVIGSNGKLTGYAGGVKAKEWLLKHEKAIMI